MAWYYEAAGQQRGPVTEDEFAKLVQAGEVRAETLVWRDGWTDWKPYGQAAGGDAADDTAVCAVSGQRRPKRDMLEYEGRWVSAEHKEEFFQRLREGVSQRNEMVYATFSQRFGAKIIDGVILWLVNTAMGAGVGAAMGAWLLSGGDAGRATAGAFAIQAVVQLLSIGVGVGYSLYFIRKQDATPGKRMLGLKVLRADGSRLSKGRIVGRHFAELVSGLILCVGYLMVAFDKEERRALHDRMCDTRVVKI